MCLFLMINWIVLHKIGLPFWQWYRLTQVCLEYWPLNEGDYGVSVPCLYLTYVEPKHNKPCQKINQHSLLASRLTADIHLYSPVTVVHNEQNRKENNTKKDTNCTNRNLQNTLSVRRFLISNFRLRKMTKLLGNSNINCVQKFALSVLFVLNSFIKND